MELTRIDLLETTLRDVLRAWKYDADQGDGIFETDYKLYSRAMELVNTTIEERK